MKTEKRPWTEKEVTLLRTEAANRVIAQRLNRSEASVRGKRTHLGVYSPEPPAPEIAAIATPDPEKVRAVTSPREFGRIPLKIFDGGGWTRLGLVSDTHLCCKEERLDALHAQYDLFKSEGIKTVFHAGNIVDGYIQRINGDSVYSTTPDGQAQYVVDNYPTRAGITTHFITGDDHESWFAPGFNFGAYLEMVANREGRKDLVYIGHVEGDCELKCGKHSQILKIQHPGGGSAYARSYKGQKMAESFQGGEKPAILIQGHFHTSGYTFDRNIHIVGMPGMQDQTVFGRKKHLRFEVGGCIIEFKMSPTTGAITRFRPEFNFFFDRGFYKPFLKSDARLLKGHIVIKAGK